MTRELDELEQAILRRLARGALSATDLTTALGEELDPLGVKITRVQVVYRLGGLVSLKLVSSQERKERHRPPFMVYSLRPAPPVLSAPLVVAEPPTPLAPPTPAPTPLVNTNTPANTTDQHPAEVAPPKLTRAQLAARLELIKARRRALTAEGRLSPPTQGRM